MESKVITMLTEVELKAQMESAIKKRTEDCLAEFNAACAPILEKYKCVLTTSVDVVLNGQAVGVIIKAV